MLQLETKNKLNKVIKDVTQLAHSEDTKLIMSVWRKREDPLTAAVFGIAAYLPFQELLGLIMQSAQKLCGSFPPGVTEDDVLKAELWPEVGRQEPDAIWHLKNGTLIIETKTPYPYASHSAAQLLKYFRAVQEHQSTRNPNSPIWLLSVGKRSLSWNTLSSLKLRDNWYLLYVEWRTILSVIQKKSEGCTENHIKRALDDLVEVLQNRPLRPFGGFSWPETVGALKSDKNLVEIVREEWFHYEPITWPNLPQVPICVSPLPRFTWFHRSTWPFLNQITIQRFPPISWLRENNQDDRKRRTTK